MVHWALSEFLLLIRSVISVLALNRSCLHFMWSTNDAVLKVVTRTSNETTSNNFKRGLFVYCVISERGGFPNDYTTRFCCIKTSRELEISNYQLRLVWTILSCKHSRICSSLLSSQLIYQHVDMSKGRMKREGSVSRVNLNDGHDTQNMRRSGAHTRQLYTYLLELLESAS